jgi:hypothetical protein
MALELKTRLYVGEAMEIIESFPVEATNVIAPLFQDKGVCAVAGGFHFPLDNFVAFDFVSIHTFVST